MGGDFARNGPDLPRYEEQKRSGRDFALAKRHPDRAFRVRGWTHWPHSKKEIAAIRRFVETGDDTDLPRDPYGFELYPKEAE